MHKTVYERFAETSVVLFDTAGPYRPKNMAEHVDFVQYYDPDNRNPKPADPAQARADDIEAKWKRAKDASTAVAAAKAAS